MMRARLRGRRWLVVPVNVQHRHWSMTIFDREEGHLYIFDTAGTIGHSTRDLRIQSICELWAEFWYLLGFSHRFQYFVPETTPQAGNYECGYLGIMWVIHTLRLRAGRPMTPADRHEGPTLRYDGANLDLSGRQAYDLATSALGLADWVPSNYRSARAACRDVFHIIRHMLHNELGLPNPQGQAVENIRLDPNNSVNGDWTFNVGILGGPGYMDMTPVFPGLRLELSVLRTGQDLMIYPTVQGQVIYRMEQDKISKETGQPIGHS
ncbi:hypothetical protein ACO1O0_006667 [Amphichorda felina]